MQRDSRINLAGSISSVTLAEIFSSGGFYFFSGRFSNANLEEFGSRLVHYFPYSLQSFAFWMGVVMVVHVAFALTRVSSHRQA